MSLSKQEKLKLCVGCHNNFYNGNNPYNIEECWSLKSAKVVKRKKVHISQVPPWKQSPIRILNCRYEPQYIFTEHEN